MTTTSGDDRAASARNNLVPHFLDQTRVAPMMVDEEASAEVGVEKGLDDDDDDDDGLAGQTPTPVKQHSKRYSHSLDDKAKFWRLIFVQQGEEELRRRLQQNLNMYSVTGTLLASLAFSSYMSLSDRVIKDSTEVLLDTFIVLSAVSTLLNLLVVVLSFVVSIQLSLQPCKKTTEQYVWKWEHLMSYIGFAFQIGVVVTGVQLLVVGHVLYSQRAARVLYIIDACAMLMFACTFVLFKVMMVDTRGRIESTFNEENAGGLTYSGTLHASSWFN